MATKMSIESKRETIQSAIFLEPDNLTIIRNGKPLKDYDSLVSDIVTRGQGAKVTRVKTYRPLIKEWKVEGVINSFYDDSNFLKQCLELGGLRYGLLSHRPEFGRFIITKWTMTK